VNVYGNQSNTLNQNNIQQCDSGYLAFGTTDQLGVQHFSFTEGAKWNMYFKIDNQPMYGTMGCMENDSVFLVLGRVGNANTAIIKATTSGRIIWSNWYSTGTDERPDKIVRLKNGDYLISTRTNISYYEFGEWGSRSCVFRIDANGKLLWNRLLDYRSANTYSLVLGMHETDNNNIFITQIYNNKLGLYKLSADGDSLKSALSSQDFTAAASAFDKKINALFVVSSDNKILKLDTSFGVLWHKSISHTNLNSLSYIMLPTDSTLAVGGKYNNDAVIINLDRQGNVDKAYFKRFVYSTPSTMMGLFKVNNDIISLISQGFAVSKHNSNLSNTCFNVVNGSQFTVNTLSNLTFGAGVPIKGTATYDELKDIELIKYYEVLPSSNCLNLDIGARLSGNYNYKLCNTFNLRLYISNYGVTGVSNFRIKVVVEGKVYDTLVNYNLVTSSSMYFDYNGLALQGGENKVKGFVYLPNASADMFNANDTFSFIVNAYNLPKIHLSGIDSICPNHFAELKISGPAGDYQWYNNFQFLTISNKLSYMAQKQGNYYVIYSDSGCTYSSDTIVLNHYDIPTKPTIAQNGNQLITDANPTIFWYYNGVLLDSFNKSVEPKKTGLYKVISFDARGCYSESDPFDFSTGSVLARDIKAFKLIDNRAFYWGGAEPVIVTCFNFNGQKIKTLRIEPGEIIEPHLAVGLYIIRVDDGANASFAKVIIRPNSQ
jgi:hypothetical protein